MRKYSLTLMLIFLLGLVRGCNPLPALPGDPALSFLEIFLPGGGGNDSVSPDRADPDGEGEEPGSDYAPSPRPATRPALSDLPVPSGLEPKVALWEEVYANYDSDQIIIFNSERPEIIYLAVSDGPGAKDRAIEQLQIRLITLDLVCRNSNDPATDLLKEPNGPALLELYNQLAKVPGDDKYLHAANTLGTRKGRRDILVSAYRRAAPYLPAMERMFQVQGVPPALTRLVFVESMFKRGALSSKAAAGVWQFIPSTASRYLSVTPALDERRDPITATRAAAMFLKENYYRLGSWPLAVTAYNAGPGLISSAIRRTGSRHLTVILEESENDDIGFAVENYYAQLLAILRAEKKLGLAPSRASGSNDDSAPKSNLNPLEYDALPLPNSIFLSTLSAKLGMNPELLVALNPVFTPAVENSYLRIPKNYLLRIPKGSEPIVRNALDLPAIVSSAE